MQLEDRNDRVRRRTPRRINERLDARSEARVRRVAAEGDEAIRRRLAALDREWDVDRVMMLFLGVAGTIVHEISLRGGPRWLHRILRAQLAVLGAYALIGWVPPLPLLRLLGARTKLEIERERETLLRLGAAGMH